jgi:hypothetical protein
LRLAYGQLCELLLYEPSTHGVFGQALTMKHSKRLLCLFEK